MARVCDGEGNSQEVNCRPADINGWHDAAFTFDFKSGVITLYVDGVMQDIKQIDGYTPAPKKLRQGIYRVLSI